jgi:hypothetical protein
MSLHTSSELEKMGNGRPSQAVILAKVAAMELSFF